MRRITSIVTTVALGATLAALGATSPVAAADPADRLVGRTFDMRSAAQSPRRAGAAEQLVSATAIFARRVDGMPVPGAAPHQQLDPGAVLAVSYGYHWETDALTYHFEVRPTAQGSRPSDQPVTLAGAGLGVFNGGVCTIDTGDFDAVDVYNTDLLIHGSGDETTAPNAPRWDCAALFVQSADGATTYDAFVAPLDVVTATPRLALKAPRKDRLVTGVWTRIPVKVTNSSPEGIDARDVVVAGTGKGVKVRRLTLEALDGQDDTEGYVWAKLVRPKAKLKLVVTELGESVGRATVKLTRRPVPAPPKAGRWSAQGVDFTVRGAKVRGFRIFTQTTCGGYPDVLTTTNNTYDFPTVRIPRNNEVVGSDGIETGDAAYVVRLDLEFVSPTRAKGKFSYFGPARCSAIDGFTAKLKR